VTRFSVFFFVFKDFLAVFFNGDMPPSIMGLWVPIVSPSDESNTHAKKANG
jgi:hypothetical protein